MTRVLKPLKLPQVTAYLIAGVLVGPYCFGALGIDGLGFATHEAVESLSNVSQVALGFATSLSLPSSSMNWSVR